MKAKKVLGFVLAGTMIAALAGCGSTGGTAKEKTDTDKKERRICKELCGSRQCAAVR